MNLRALMARKNLNKQLVVVLLLTLLPTGFGPLPNANAVKASSLTSNSLEASCASTASDTSSAKLDVIVDGNYCVLSFLSSTNTWNPPALTPSVDYLIVGGGGGGAGGRGGGGGAGGFLTGNVSTPTSISVSVANGGAGGANNSSGSNGETSTISYSATTINAVGGGGGGTSFGNASVFPARSGASGGGAGVYISFTTSNTEIGTPGGTGISGQGNNGGSSGGKNLNDGLDSSYSYKGTCTQNWDQVRNTAGGGGAGGKGIAGRGGASTLQSPANLTGCTPTVAPDGGPGASSKITGTVRFYAAGGGGSAGTFNKYSENINYYTAGPGAGGSGIGGAGSPIAGTNGGAAVANTGSGGGGGGVSRTTDTDKGICASGSDGDESCDGGAGSSGVVILRFLAPNFNSDYTACNNGFSPNSIYADSRTVSYVAGDCLIILGAKDESTQPTYYWQVPQGVLFAQILIVGGGGGGGNYIGGGGGGGQVLDSSTVPVRLSPGETYTLTIGLGGDHKAGWNQDHSANGGYNGQSSTFSGTGVNLSALGGGGAAGANLAADATPNLTGWTRGGCGSYNTPCTGTPVGDTNRIGGTNSAFGDAAMGGGGDGGPGGNGGRNQGDTATAIYQTFGGGRGGAGTYTSIVGSLICFGGGGSGGATYDTTTPSNSWRASATCGGGTGARGPLSYGGQITSATAGTGGGGGGAGVLANSGNGNPTAASSAEGGHGGSGIIIIRFTVSNPRGATTNLNMACHAFSLATSVEQSRSAGYFGTPFTTDTTTTEFTFDSLGYNSMFGHDWGFGGPGGCGTSGDYYTVYAWGYLQNPTGVQQNIYFEKQADDGLRLVIDGKVFFDEDAQYTTVSNNVTYINMKPGSWHFVQLWKHEVTGLSSVGIRYKLSGNSPTQISSSFLSRYVPRTITSSTIPSVNRYNETLTVSMTVDTSTEVIGGVNDSATTMSNRGKFTFYDSQTALSGCTNVYSGNGAFKCSWYVKPSALGFRTIKVVFTPDSSTSMTDLQYNVFRRVEWTQAIEVTKGRQSPLRIGQYAAFIGVSSYPLNVYPDTSIYPNVGTTYTRSVTTGTAGCQLDPTRFFVTDTLPDTSTGGSCVATVVLSEDSNHLFAQETGTATIYFVKWSDAYATQVPSGAHTIPLNGGTQIIVHTETVTVTDTATAFRDLSNNVITSAAAGDEIRIYISGYAGLSASDLTVTFRVYEDAVITNKTDTYVQVIVPSTATSGVVSIDSPRGVSYTPAITISP